MRMRMDGDGNGDGNGNWNEIDRMIEQQGEGMLPNVCSIWWSGAEKEDEWLKFGVLLLVLC